MEAALTQIIEMAIALLRAVIAYWQHRQKQDVVAFFDPEDGAVTTPPAFVPARSWTMDNATKQWLCAGHSVEEQGSLLQQVIDAEAQEKTSYFVSVPSGYYEIEYGLIKVPAGSDRNNGENHPADYWEISSRIFLEHSLIKNEHSPFIPPQHDTGVICQTSRTHLFSRFA